MASRGRTTSRRKFYLCVTSSVDTETIRDSRFANVKCKDAIVDRFNQRIGKRPDSGPERDGVVVYLYWKGDRCLFISTHPENPSQNGAIEKFLSKRPCRKPWLQRWFWPRSGRARRILSTPCVAVEPAIEAAGIAIGKAPVLLKQLWIYASKGLQGGNVEGSSAKR